MPKATLNTLLADPKALSDLLRAHIVMGYYPNGTLGHNGVDRTLTNLLGEKLVRRGSGEGFAINGVVLGYGDNSMLANGNRVFFINKLMMPDSK